MKKRKRASRKARVVRATIQRHGDIFVVDPILAEGGDTVVWKAPTDMIISFPEEPEAGIFLNPRTGEPVERLKIPRGRIGRVRLLKTVPDRKLPRSRTLSAHATAYATPEEHTTAEEFPYAIYWKDWEDPHSAFFVGGSHPRIVINWPEGTGGC